jgi:hypothetical protein
MASQLYPKGKKKILDADIDLLVDDIRVLLIDTADETYNAADEWHSDITGAGIVATSASDLASKTTTSGVFDAADKLIATVTGDTIEALVIYKWTGASGTSPLIAWFDLGTAFTPNGSDITIIWHSSGLFAI